MAKTFLIFLLLFEEAEAEFKLEFKTLDQIVRGLFGMSCLLSTTTLFVMLLSWIFKKGKSMKYITLIIGFLNDKPFNVLAKINTQIFFSELGISETVKPRTRRLVLSLITVYSTASPTFSNI
jgi:hypothetical protein